MTDTTNCELCGRGMAQKALTPYWWEHDTVCDRAGCRSAARDAVEAIMDARDAYKPLAGAIATRHDTMPVPSNGWRHDSMAEIDVVDGEDWWATNWAKVVENE